MRVIIKRPHTPPAVCQIGDHFTDLQRALAEPGEPPAYFESCLRDHDGGIVWCDEEYLIKGNREINFRRPSDGHPVCGTVVVTGTRPSKDGPENCDLSDEQVNRWMYLLVLFSVDEDPRRRQRMLDELRRALTPTDRDLVDRLRDQLSELRPLTDMDMEPRIVVTGWPDGDDTRGVE